MEEDFEEPMTDLSSAIKDVGEDSLIDKDAGGAARFVTERYSKAKESKRNEEDRALKAYQNFRGIYSKDVQFSQAEKSRVFIKVTKTKVLAAYGQLVDVLFGNSRFPLTVEPSRLPEGVAESVHMETSEQSQNPEVQGVMKDVPKIVNPFGVRGGEPLPPGATIFDLQRTGPLEDKLKPFESKLVEGAGTTATSITFHPAMVAAKKMEKKIHDQLDQSSASKHLRSMAFEMTLYGTGIMKGPFAYEKELPKWNDEGDYEPVFKTVPKVEHVSFWNFYPDPDAARMEDAQYIVERHKMSRKDLRALKNRPFFRSNVIENVIACGENYTKESWEFTLEGSDNATETERFEVLEYWGFCDKEVLDFYDIVVPKDFKEHDSLNVNIWVCNGEVLRLVLNPFKPSHIPYHVVPYEVNPYNMFGVGLAENMDDTQTLMNGFMRMAVDNGVLSGNMIFEVDEMNLTPGQDLNMYPGKVIKRAAGAPGQALFATQYPNVSQQNIMMFDKARSLADESTGFPSFAHGQTDVQNAGRTASGISMLMGAANGGIKTVVKNIDDYLLAPIGRAMYSFNMQFDFDKTIKGDLEVIARGTESLMANEVRSQRLMQFLGVVTNPVLAPFAKMEVIVREIAKSLDLDPDKVVNNMADAALQAEILKGFQPNPSGAPPQGAPAGAQAADPTGAGGGTMGVGMAPAPGTPGFSANGATGTGDMQG